MNYLHYPLKLLFLFLFTFPLIIEAQQLQRKIDFGVFGLSLSDGSGIEVLEVLEGHTADQMGIRPGDIIKEFGAIQVPHMGALLFWLNKKKVGDRIMILVERDGKTEYLRGVLSPKPYEESKGIAYDAFTYKDGTIRTIINRPNTTEKVPAVLFIQEYHCSTMDFAGKDYEFIPRIAAQFADAGFAFIRIEKPGVGDSRTEGKCHEIGFKEEGKMYEEAMKYVRKLEGIDKDKISILAHGFGGNQVVNAIKGGMPCSVLLWGYYNRFTSEKCRPLRDDKYWKEAESLQKGKSWSKLESRVLFYHGEFDTEDHDGEDAIKIYEYLTSKQKDSEFKVYPQANHYFMQVESAITPDMFDGDIPNPEFFRDHYDVELIDTLILWMEECW